MSNDWQSNIDEFNRELKDYVHKQVPEMAVKFQKKLVLEALKRIILKTPVDIGRARNNWQVTIGKPAKEIVDEVTRRRNKGKPPLSNRDYKVINKAKKHLEQLPPFAVVYISNNLEYISYLEDGTSKQAPHGMVALTVEELKAMFK